MEQDINFKASYSELTLRLLSAFFMVTVSLAGTWLGSWYFAALILLIALLMSREWYTLTGSNRSGILFLLHCAAIVISLTMAITHNFVWSVVSLALGVSAIFLIIKSGFAETRTPLWTSLGVLYTGLPTLTLIWFREDAAYGFPAVMYIFCLAWASDSAAFFGGRTIGGPKLWPAVSPKKTWAGFFSGLVACVLTGYLFAQIFPKADLSTILVLSILLGLAVQMGDLAESALKRNFGIKDTGALIPGHGGVLDRVDGLVFSVCVAGFIALCIDSSSPGSALLLSGAAK